jgi:hypothetical protein
MPTEQDSNKKFYQNRLTLCEQDGWMDLVEELKNLENQINSLDSVNTEKDLWFLKGQLSILRQVITLEEVAKLATEELDL